MEFKYGDKVKVVSEDNFYNGVTGIVVGKTGSVLSAYPDRYIVKLQYGTKEFSAKDLKKTRKAKNV